MYVQLSIFFFFLRMYGKLNLHVSMYAYLIFYLSMYAYLIIYLSIYLSTNPL